MLGHSVESQPSEALAVAGSRYSGRVIDRFFVRMTSNYGHLWSSRFPSGDMLSAAKAEWAQALDGFTLDELKHGIDRCFEQYGKPPSMTEFVRCCKPAYEDFGLPDFEAAYGEACAKSHEPNSPDMRWSHPAVYHAGRKVGWHGLHCGLRGVKTRFETVYQVFCQRVMAGERLSGPVLSAAALEHKAGTKTRTEQEKQMAQQWLGKMKSSLNRAGNAGGVNGNA